MQHFKQNTSSRQDMSYIYRYMYSVWQYLSEKMVKESKIPNRKNCFKQILASIKKLVVFKKNSNIASSILLLLKNLIHLLDERRSPSRIALRDLVNLLFFLEMLCRCKVLPTQIIFKQDENSSLHR